MYSSSERQVCEALLFWFANSGQFLGFGSSICGVNTLQIFEKVRFGLLPLEFILGRLWREFPSLFTSSQMMTILEQISHPILKGHSDISVGNFECFRLRLTQYSKKLDLSGCQQVTSLVLFLSLLPQGSLPAIFSSTCSSEKLKALFRKPSAAETSSEAELHLLQNSCCMASFTDLQEVNISCCWRINENDIVEWLQLSSPSLRVFQAAYCPQIKVSIPALTYIIARNPDLKVLNARGCKRMSGCSNWPEINDPSSFGSILHHGELAQELSRVACLQELAIGWGLSGLILETLKPALGSLKSLAVGLGGSLGQQAWLVLPEICPLLECISICFQVVSDEGIVNVLRNLRNIHTLELRHCFGDLTSQCLSVSAPNIKSLKLDGVACWMTDDDLTSLTQNCRNLCQLSLSGCKFLTSDAQCIIASGWPGLTKIHLEDCGKITSNGVFSLLNCKAVQDLLLRHNGSGIPRNFISDAAMKLPLLRTLSLDLCDACERGFKTPNYIDRFSLNTVKLAHCKFQRRAFELQGFSVKGSDNVQPHCVHKETIVLEWNSREFRTTIVHERL